MEKLPSELEGVVNVELEVTDRVLEVGVGSNCPRDMPVPLEDEQDAESADAGDAFDPRLLPVQDVDRELSRLVLEAAVEV